MYSHYMYHIGTYNASYHTVRGERVFALLYDPGVAGGLCDRTDDGRPARGERVGAQRTIGIAHTDREGDGGGDKDEN